MGPSSDRAGGPASNSFTPASSRRDHTRERGRSIETPVNYARDNGSNGAGRPSLDSPYRYAKQVWGAQSGSNMNHFKSTSNERDTELPPLQATRNLDEHEENSFRPITEDDPASYDLVGPAPTQEETKSKKQLWNLEKQSQALFSKEHLQVIFGNPTYLLKFTSFLGLHRPQSVPILVHYLDSLKALRAIHYSNAILEGLDEVPGLDFTKGSVSETANSALVKRATDAFDYLVREELPAFVTYEYIEIVTASISARITGMLAPHLREASEGLAEVFCLTDPARTDNPIVFASEEFNRTTQYGMSYVLGKNCRFLQGPYTNPLAVRRLREASEGGKQHQEVFLNYRRDGSPFMNLLMIAPLCDARGVVRYFIGAQVDVTGLVKDCIQMDSLALLMEKQNHNEKVPDHHKPNPEKNDELRELSEMLNMNELNTIHKFGGHMHREEYDDEDESVTSNQPRLLIKDPDTLTPPFDPNPPVIEDQNGYRSGSESRASTTSLTARLSGKLNGVYQHYLLIRPYPSLRILFASPSQRVPGILQSPFMNKIGGSNRVREELTAALADGRGVTAKVRWVSRQNEEGRNKWIHCTPLIGLNGQIGVWMVVIVDDERHKAQRDRERGGRIAPPVPADLPLRSKETPDKNDPGRTTPGKSQRARTPSATANAAHRYGYSAGDRPTVVDEPRASADGQSQGSVRDFAI